jgi:hypothetical protein
MASLFTSHSLPNYGGWQEQHNAAVAHAVGIDHPGEIYSIQRKVVTKEGRWISQYLEIRDENSH